MQAGDHIAFLIPEMHIPASLFDLCAGRNYKIEAVCQFFEDDHRSGKQYALTVTNLLWISLICCLREYGAGTVRCDVRRLVIPNQRSPRYSPIRCLPEIPVALAGRCYAVAPSAVSIRQISS